MALMTVVDYGMGNLRSVARALEHVAPAATRVQVSDRAAAIERADRVVFPGQGAARDCMRAIDAHALREPLMAAARSRPFLGMCMGLQVLLDYSEENGGTDCLGLLPGQVRAFPRDLHTADGERCKIPHMGWNRVHATQPHPLWEGIAADSRFYFVHGYYAVPAHAGDTAATTDHGGPFCAALARDNVFACQFHPEKSSSDGLRLLRNFIEWTP